MKTTLSILAGLLATHASFGAIYITEIMYDPAGPIMPDATHEFVEVYNTINGSSVNVEDWNIDNGGSPVVITASTLMLAPGAFLVLGNISEAAFESAYNVTLSAGQYIQVAGGLPSLSNSGATITITNTNTVSTVASVSYANGSGGWPTGVAGNSITLSFLPEYAAPGDYQVGTNWSSHNTTMFDPNGLLATVNDAGGFASPGYMLPVPEPTSALLMGFGILLLRKVRSRK